jgi:hypothetical protein
MQQEAEQAAKTLQHELSAARNDRDRLFRGREWEREEERSRAEESRSLIEELNALLQNTQDDLSRERKQRARLNSMVNLLVALFHI